jgi:hypothetical protein
LRGALAFPKSREEEERAGKTRKEQVENLRYGRGRPENLRYKGKGSVRPDPVNPVHPVQKLFWGCGYAAPD